MTARFCTKCGAKLLAEAQFCIECGASSAAGPGPRATPATLLPRYAPLLITVVVVAVGAVAVMVGLMNPKTAPPAPRRSEAPAAAGEGSMPPGHPPVQIPEEVKQTIRDLAAQAAAAPSDTAKWKQLAEVQLRAAQIELAYLADAESSYKRVLELEPQNLDVIRALGNITFDRKDTAKAIAYYQQYLDKKPDDLEVKTDLGTMQLTAGHADQALRTYEEVLKSDSKFFQAQFNTAIAYRSQGDAEKTAAALVKARDIAPDDATRTQVDQLIAHLKEQLAAPAGSAPMAPAAMPPGAPAAAAPGGSFQADAESLFRQNPVLGPKVQRVEWSGATAAKVVVRDFPMDQMGEEMRDMFTDRMKGRIREKKTTHKVTDSTRFEIFDEAAGRVVETITE